MSLIDTTTSAPDGRPPGRAATAEGTASSGGDRGRSDGPGGATAPAGAARSAAATLVGTVVGAAANFAMLAVIGQLYGPEAFGIFGAITALFLVITMVTRLGADQGATWAVSRLLARGHRGAVRGLLRVSVAPVLVCSAAVAIAVFVAAGPLAQLLADDATVGDYRAMLRVVALAIPAAAVGEVLLGATRGFGSMRPTVIASQLGRQVGQLVLVVVTLFFTRDLAVLAAAWALPYLAIVIFPAWWLRTALAPSDDADAEGRTFWRYSGSQAANQTAQIGLEKLDIILLGPLAGLAAQASYNAANRLTHLAVLAWYAMNLPNSALWARLFEQDRNDEVARSAKVASGWGVLIVGPLLASYLLFGHVWTGLLSPDLEQGGSALAVLAAGLFAVLLLGPCENLLLMAGHSGRSFVNNLVALAVNIGCNLLLIPRFGAVGAAISWVVALAVVRLLASWFLWRERGVAAWSSSALLAAVIVGCTYGVSGLFVVIFGATRSTLALSLLLATPFYVVLVWMLRGPLALPEVPAMPARLRRALPRRLGGAGAAPVSTVAVAPAMFRPTPPTAASELSSGGVAVRPEIGAMLEGAHLLFAIRSAATCAMPVSAARLRVLLDIVPAVGIRGRALRRLLLFAGPMLHSAPQLLPRLQVQPSLHLPFGHTLTAEVLQQAAQRLGEPFDNVIWLLPPSRQERRVGVLLLRGEEPVGHLRMMERHPDPGPRPFGDRGVRSGVRWPVVLDRWLHRGISCELSTALPVTTYRPARLDAAALLAVIDDLRDALNPRGVPSAAGSRIGMHGDLTPWNLLQGPDGQLVLFDWEHVGFGPPEADLVRYLASLGHGERYLGELPAERRAAVAAAATFWLHERDRRSFGEPTRWKQRGRRQETERLERLGGSLDAEPPAGFDTAPHRFFDPLPAGPSPLSAAQQGPGALVRRERVAPVRRPPRPASMLPWRGEEHRLGQAEPETSRLFPAARPHRRRILGATVAVALLSMVFGLPGFVTTALEAKVVLRDPWGADPTLVERPVGGDYERFVRAQRQLFVSPQLLERAAAAVDEPVGALADDLTVVADAESTSLTLKVEAGSERAARARFDAIVDAYRELRREVLLTGVTAQLNALTEERRERPDDTALEQREAEIRLALQRYGDGVSVVQIEKLERAVHPLGLVVRGVLGAMGGLTLGLSAAWIGALWHTRVRDVASLERRFDLHALGAVAHLERLRRTTVAERAGYSHAARAVLHRLSATPTRTGGRAYCVVVTGVGDAPASAATLLMEGAREAGFSTDTFTIDDQPLDVGLDRLDALRRQELDLLILACPPATEHAAALRLSEYVDGVVLVVPRGTPTAEVAETAAMFRRLDTRHRMAVLTMRRS